MNPRILTETLEWKIVIKLENTEVSGKKADK